MLMCYLFIIRQIGLDRMEGAINRGGGVDYAH